ncbi:13521_t:CDS:2 [Cetraspora pellucida]|uniref:13521_t:CDS:1 n=1 Tax=Cetraspora pellucida TaxID=1433469 RepID=A0A9N9AJZ5_9GLOM|nr:13521_t:CDS:2 [Cetraspora pellucida]
MSCLMYSHNYNLTSGLFYQYNNNTFASHSQLSIYLANKFTNNEVINNESKKIKLNNKKEFTQFFFDFYKLSGAQPKDK